MRIIPAQYYQETLPAETAEMRECERLGIQTLARAEEMKKKAMMQGYLLKLSPRDYLDASAKFFEFKESPRDPASLPKLKMSDAILLATINKPKEL